MDRVADEELVRAVADGRDEAFTVLLRRHAAGVTGFFARRLRSAEDAEEAVQDTFVKVRRGAGTFNGTRHFRPWLGAIARNVLRDRLRSTPRIDTVPLVADEVAARPQESCGEEVRGAIKALPKKYRSALALKYLAGLTYAEAAAELGLSVKGFETRLARAREKLREALRRSPDGMR